MTNIDVLWDETSGETIAAINYKNKTYIGTAHCHPEDEDMKSKLTGGQIASLRAQIAASKAQRDEVKVELKALNHLYHNLMQAKAFNPLAHEVKMLKRQIKMREKELEQYQVMINELRDELRDYITNKEQFYKKIRKARREDKTD